jgi:protein-tyrosine phosphatase
MKLPSNQRANAKRGQPLFSPPCPDLSQVCPSVFVSSAKVAADVARLHAAGISLVITAASSGRPPADPSQVVVTCEGTDRCQPLSTDTALANVLQKVAAINGSGKIAYVWLKLEDNPKQDIAPYLRPIATLIHLHVTTGGKALVHCLLGVSRSVTLVTGYMLVNGVGGCKTLEEALALIRIVRPIAQPQPTFCVQLFKLERALKGERDATALVSNGAAPEVIGDGTAVAQTTP